MSKSKLQQAINSVNKRYLAGRNDDDQVARMCNEDRKTKGWSFWPSFDTYELISDEEKMKRYVDKYGYWSDQISNFNDVLLIKGGIEYRDKLNVPYTGTKNSK